MSLDELASALLAGATGSFFSEQAAVGLLVEHRTWLARRELLHAVEVAVADGQVQAWVEWTDIGHGPASSSECRMLCLIRSPAGCRSDESLAELVTSLDDTNLARVLRAIHVACRGVQAPVPDLSVPAGLNP